MFVFLFPSLSRIYIVLEKINIRPKGLVFAHMVCLETLSCQVNFFDSYGRPPNANIHRMIKNSGINRFNINTRRLQNKGSADCASFVLFYLLMRCRNTDFLTVINQKFSLKNKQNHWVVPRLIRSLLSRRYLTQHRLDKTFFLSHLRSMTAVSSRPQFGNYSPDQGTSLSDPRPKVADRRISPLLPGQRVADIDEDHGEKKKEKSKKTTDQPGKKKKCFTPKGQEINQKTKKANRQKNGKKKSGDKVRIADTKGTVFGLSQSISSHGIKRRKKRSNEKKAAVGRERSKALLLKIAQMNVGLLKMVLDNSYS